MENYTEQLKKDFATKFPEGGVRNIIEKSLSELEEFGDLHEDNCGVNSDENYPDACDCDMKGMKPFVEVQMQLVNNWWVKMTQEHRKYCTPEGNKILTCLQGKKNRRPKQ